MKKNILFVVILLVLASCAPKAPILSDADLVETAVAKLQKTQNAEKIMSDALATAEASMITPTLVFTKTPIPSATVRPSLEKAYSWNFLAEKTSSNVKLEIARILLANKNDIKNNSDLPFDTWPVFDNTNVVMEIIFRVTNNGNDVVNVYPDQSTLIIGNEQIELTEFMFYSPIIGDVSGEIYPGVTKIGGLWVGIKRSDLESINQFTLVCSGPFNNNLITKGEDFRFDIDISEKKTEPFPAELDQ